MKLKLIALFFLVGTLTACNSNAFGAKFCVSEVEVNQGESNQIHVDSERAIRQLRPEFFGFNLEWVEFQGSLWDKTSQRTRSDVVTWLKSFPGAVYRYPGGTIANSMNWRDTVGTSSERKSRRYVDWTGPFAASFGLNEYLEFVKEVDGKAWYVANIYGDANGEISIEKLSAEAGQLSRYLADKKIAGYPEIFRWELGNELDRGQYRWSADKVSAHSKFVLEEIKRNDPDAKFVALMQDYPAQSDKGISQSQYNRRLVRGIHHQTSEYAKHIYYDGKPAAPPVPNRVKSICEAISDAKFVSSQNTPSIWITEHARVPPNAWVDPNWKQSWHRTADLEAAIGVADMVISVVQIPEVQGTFIHTLHGTDGPWPIFHKQKTGGLHPGAVYWALRILRESTLADVLPTGTTSKNSSNYDGGYDVRAVVMADTERKHYSLWAINRDSQSVDTRLSIAALKNLKLSGKQVWLSDQNLRANNYLDGTRLTPKERPIEIEFDERGDSKVMLPESSVSAITFSLEIKEKQSSSGTEK